MCHFRESHPGLAVSRGGDCSHLSEDDVNLVSAEGVALDAELALHGFLPLALFIRRRGRNACTRVKTEHAERCKCGSWTCKACVRTEMDDICRMQLRGPVVLF